MEILDIKKFQILRGIIDLTKSYVISRCFACSLLDHENTDHLDIEDIHNTFIFRSRHGSCYKMIIHMLEDNDIKYILVNYCMDCDYPKRRNYMIKIDIKEIVK